VLAAFQVSEALVAFEVVVELEALVALAAFVACLALLLEFRKTHTGYCLAALCFHSLGI
jgi:hypothetical protein